VNRAQLRKIEEEIRRLIYADCCSLCRRPFECNDKTYGGVIRSGAAAYTGDCCVAQLIDCAVYGCKIE
jgi:hypothetical protein